jgi:hypothetical protein
MLQRNVPDLVVIHVFFCLFIFNTFTHKISCFFQQFYRNCFCKFKNNVETTHFKNLGDAQYQKFKVCMKLFTLQELSKNYQYMYGRIVSLTMFYLFQATDFPVHEKYWP